MMKRWVCLLGMTGVFLGATATQDAQVEVDMARLRTNVTNLCIRAVRTEDVWATGARIKSHYRFSDAEMTELLSGCLPLLEGRTDYKVSYYHLYGLMQRTCGTNAAPVLAGAVRANRSQHDVMYAYSAYTNLMNFDESCFELGCEILDSEEFGLVARRGVFAQVARCFELAGKSGDRVLENRCNDFYLRRQMKDSDFRQFVGYWRWPRSNGGAHE